jgi:hypothetical protein
MTLQAHACLSCGRTSIGTASFCSPRCRDWFDTGNPPYSKPDLSGWYRTRDGKILPLGQSGFQISCIGCGKTFDSKGLRCCSADCEQHYREREDRRAVMADAGMEPASKRLCAECGQVIPTWRAGRRIRQGAQFCSKTCAQKARRRAVPDADIGSRLGGCPGSGFEADNAQKVPVNQASKSASDFSSVVFGGGAP